MARTVSARQRSFKKKDSKTIFLVRIAGTYRNSQGKEHLEKPYDVVVRMDREMVKAGPTSAFCKFYADDVLRAKYPDYERFITHKFVEAKVEGDENADIDELDLMSYDRLVELIEDEGLIVRPEMYPDVEELKDAIMRNLDDESGFKKEQDFKRKHKKTELGLKSRARALMAGHQPVDIEDFEEETDDDFADEDAKEDEYFRRAKQLKRKREAAQEAEEAEEEEDDDDDDDIVGDDDEDDIVDENGNVLGKAPVPDETPKAKAKPKAAAKAKPAAKGKRK